MKLKVSPPADNRVHIYCYNCQSDAVLPRRKDYRCPACNSTLPRALIIDPAVEWWTDNSKEYWHEVAGVFVANPAGKFLFFERNRYPFGVTVPAGHVDRGEIPIETAAREVGEETGIRLRVGDLTPVSSDDVRGDQCRRGSDAHRWHTFSVRLSSNVQVKIDSSEGAKPMWLTPEEAKRRKLTFVTRHIIDLHGKRIVSSVQG